MLGLSGKIGRQQKTKTGSVLRKQKQYQALVYCADRSSFAMAKK